MTIILSVLFIILSVSLTQLFYFAAGNTRLMDKPNERSMHTKPTVRGGGVVFIGLSLLSIPYLLVNTPTSFQNLLVLALSILSLAGISFLDDLYQLSAKTRLLVQIFVALMVALFMLPERLDFALFDISNSYLMAGFLFLAVIWAINHFNFMDGLDGLCASQALFLFTAYFLLFDGQHAEFYKNFCLIMGSSLFGFLLFNFPPAKLFMGDVGSASLGLICFVMAVIAQEKYHIPIIYWFVLNGLFLFDATLTLFRRMIHKEKIFAAHRKHAYQRLKQLGVSNRMILLGQLVLNILFLSLVLLHEQELVQLSWVLLIPLVVMVIIYWTIERLFPMFERHSSKGYPA